MPDVFISYSRKDKAFVQVLNDAPVESKYDALGIVNLIYRIQN